jgi:hypothetical protein
MTDSNATPATPRPDATAIISAWLAQHPDLAADLKGHDEASFRETVLSFLYPYDRFPETLGALVREALATVDWRLIADEIRG